MGKGLPKKIIFSLLIISYILYSISPAFIMAEPYEDYTTDHTEKENISPEDINVIKMPEETRQRYQKMLERMNDIRNDYQELLDREKGTLFEKSIANFVASAAYSLTFMGNALLDFADLDTLIFNKNTTGLPPFDEDHWEKMDEWYKTISYIAASFLTYAAVMVGVNFIRSGTNPKLREKAIESLKRLTFSWVITASAPNFVKMLFRTNNTLVEAIASTSVGSVANQIGSTGGILYNIRTGNVIATSFIILLFSFINFKLNIMFVIRQFVITVLYIFTPFVTVMWVINENVNAAGIWLGEMLSNAFMQFSYAFVFTIFLSFAGENLHWAKSIIWAMMCLSVADVIRNSVQSLQTRLSGIDESQHAGKIMSSLIGVGGLASMANTVGGQFVSARGPTGGGIADVMRTTTGSKGGFQAKQSHPANRGGSRAQGINVGTAESVSGNKGPLGDSIEKASTFAKVLDQSAGAGYYAERGVSGASGIANAAAGTPGAGFVKGVGRAVGMGVRGIGGAVGMTSATKKHMKEQGLSFKDALKDLTGTDSTQKAFLRAGNLYASHVFTSQARVRDKLASYHTSIDGMRYK